VSLILESTPMLSTFELQETAFRENPYPAEAYRRGKLKSLKKELITMQDAITDALNADFGNRSATESTLVDIVSSVNLINYTLSHLKKWLRPQNRSIGLLFFPAKAEIHYQPKGVIGIMTPWNYPIYLSIGPLISAIAAGNRVMIKMSEYTPNTNRVIAELLDRIFTTSEVAVVEGEADISSEFSSLPFDHLFFTGSTNVGKAVMASAAKNLTPVTLELGGKSPAVLAQDYSVSRFVRNFLLGKTLNSGQTCVAPDTLYVPESRCEAVIDQLIKEYNQIFPSETRSSDCTSLIHDKHWDRIQHLLQDARDKGATVIALSEEQSPLTRQMPVTLVINPTPDMLLTQEEIFGPLLPIITYSDIDSVVKEIQSQPRALALYLFTNKLDLQRKFLYLTHSGGVCLNDSAFHVGVDDLPFGGVGDSGMGSYHADEGFKTFTHAKSVMIRGRINLTPLIGPPYGKSLHRLFERLFLR